MLGHPFSPKEGHQFFSTRLRRLGPIALVGRFIGPFRGLGSSFVGVPIEPSEKFGGANAIQGNDDKVVGHFRTKPGA